MKIVKINPQKPSLAIIKEAALLIKKGGILAYPTDTCYGLGVNPQDKKAVKKLLGLKGRPAGKSISVIVSDIKMIQQICQLDNQQEKILSKFLPGAFTFVLKKRNGRETLGIRIPDYLITALLAKKLAFPYTTTSANRSGGKECYDVGCIIEQFREQKNQPALVLDAGTLPQNPFSTVIDLTGAKPKILRTGGGKFFFNLFHHLGKIHIV